MPGFIIMTTEYQYTGDYIGFIEHQNEGRATKYWSIYNKTNKSYLGIITWSTGWRKYIFAPEDYTRFEETCLRDIAAFIEQKTKEQKDGAKIRKESEAKTS